MNTKNTNRKNNFKKENNINEEEKIINIFKDLNEGKIKQFPKNFWKENIEFKAKVLLNYLFKTHLEWSEKDMSTKLSRQVFINFRLLPILNFYNKDLQKIANLIYENIEINKEKFHWGAGKIIS